MNVRRGPLQKKLDALKASTHIDEEFNAVMNVNENSNDSEPNQNLNNSLKGTQFGFIYLSWFDCCIFIKFVPFIGPVGGPIVALIILPIILSFNAVLRQPIEYVLDCNNRLNIRAERCLDHSRNISFVSSFLKSC